MIQIVWIMVITFLSFAIAIPVIRTFDEGEAEPFELKAYVFSQIMNARYTGGKTIVTTGKVRTIDKHGIRDKKFNVEYVVKTIKYRMGFIESAGTAYLKKGSVSFQPVTGKMVVRIK